MCLIKRLGKSMVLSLSTSVSFKKLWIKPTLLLPSSLFSLFYNVFNLTLFVIKVLLDISPLNISIVYISFFKPLVL